jgi:hypothetical protein
MEAIKQSFLQDQWFSAIAIDRNILILQIPLLAGCVHPRILGIQFWSLFFDCGFLQLTTAAAA